MDDEYYCLDIRKIYKLTPNIRILYHETLFNEYEMLRCTLTAICILVGIVNTTYPVLVLMTESIIVSWLQTKIQI